MEKILITGGTGYIGSHTVKELLKNQYQPIIYDNLVNGHRQAILGGILIKGDLKDKKRLLKVLAKYQPEAVIHFAALIEVGESVKNSEKFFQENVFAGINLLQAMIECDIKKIVFSSSAAVYGEPKKVPIKENYTTLPTNPYGLTKLQFEQILKLYEKIYGLKFISLRYFNAAGADPEGELGEDHFPETHLIPLVLKTALGQRDYIEIFGNSYPTPDGTCIRDFIHVTDLAQAHLLALEFLNKKNKSRIFNLGNEKGNSVLEIINLAKKITQRDIPIKIGPKRPGDPTKLVASSQRIKKELGWRPRYSDIKTIIQTAWSWHKNHPFGYSK